MDFNNKYWKRLFLFCMGLAVGSAFCMKWMEPDLWFNGEKFTIIGLELNYGRERIVEIFSGVDERVRTILRYHLYFDFIFMAGVFPGIASLCMISRGRNNKGWIRKLLFVLAALQLFAWGCDVFENLKLLKWLSRPITTGELEFFHLIVWTKFVIALTGILAAIFFFIKRKV